MISVYLCFFFFKQKTAYEMRISDWSSDVCSSDLRDGPMRRRSAMRWSWRQGRQRPSSPGSGSAGSARGERACLVDVLGEVDLLPEIGRASCRERVCQYV